jgi:hypothetical protein
VNRHDLCALEHFEKRGRGAFVKADLKDAHSTISFPTWDAGQIWIQVLRPAFVVAKPTVKRPATQRSTKHLSGRLFAFNGSGAVSISRFVFALCSLFLPPHRFGEEH